MRYIPVVANLPGNGTGARDFLKSWAEFFNLLSGALQCVRIAELSLTPDFSNGRHIERRGEGHGVTKVPSFKFVTCNAHQRIGPSGILAKFHEFGLQNPAIRGILVAEDDKFIFANALAPQFSGDTSLDILFSFMGNT